MKKGDALKNLCEQIKYVLENQPYMLRNVDDFRILRLKSTQMLKSLFYKHLQLCNVLLTNIKTTYF